jgi:N-acetylneuraminate synthase
MKLTNDFQLENLFIYDMANNHQGDLEHGKRIIREIGKVNAEAGVRGALKFQFRQLDTFIHPDYK